MALPPRQSLFSSASATAVRVRQAVQAAKGLAGNEGQLVALSAGGFFVCFFLLALVAPFLMRAPGFVSLILGGLLFLVLLFAIGTGAVALWRLIAAGAMEGGGASKPAVAIFSQPAIEAALSDAEDAGLRARGPRVATDAVTGRVFGRAIACIACDGKVYAVVRLADAVPASIVIAPRGDPWPFALPNDGQLTPIPAPGSINALAWSTDRSKGMAWANCLAGLLKMSEAGGDVPFVSVRNKALVMMWQTSDVGTAALLAHEAAKAVSGPTG